MQCDAMYNIISQNIEFQEMIYTKHNKGIEGFF